MAVSDFILTKQVKCINNKNNTNNENEPLIDVNNVDIPPLVKNFDDGIMVISEQEQELDMLKTLTSGDTIKVREFYDNQHLYSSFGEFINIKLGIDTNE